MLECLPTYDANGNLTAWGPIADRRTYTYDSENRLRTASLNGSLIASYDYDPLGRRISKVANGAGTFYQLDGDEEIAEYGAAGSSLGALLRRYVVGSAIDDRIARVEVAGAEAGRHFYRVNHQGSVILTTSETGVVRQQLAYDETGVLTSQQPPASTTGEQFRYTGRRYDQETGLYYYRARYYSPESGRFLQTDPIGYRDDFNLYAYVKNDPLNLTDPTGAIAGVDDAIIIGGAVLIAGAATVACQPGSACNEGISDALTKTGDAISDAHQSIVTSIVDEVERIEKAMEAREHTKNARPSTKGKHEKGQAAKARGRGGEKGDSQRDPPRKRPDDWNGPWPPKKAEQPAAPKREQKPSSKPICTTTADGKSECK